YFCSLHSFRYHDLPVTLPFIPAFLVFLISLFSRRLLLNLHSLFYLLQHFFHCLSHRHFVCLFNLGESLLPLPRIHHPRYAEYRTQCEADDHHRGTPPAYHRQRLSRHREEPHRHQHVQERLEYYHNRQPQHHQGRERIITFPRYLHPPVHQRQIGHNHYHRSKQP